jgi:hypothetical protein
MGAKASPWAFGLLIPAVLLGLLACGTVTTSVRRHGTTDLLVQDFCRSFGRKQGRAVSNLFADSARFDIEGADVSFVGRDGIARLADYGAAVHSRLVARNIEVRHDTVRCRLDEENDWLGLLGVGHASYDGWFLVSGTKLVAVRVHLTPQSSDELGGRLAGFATWLIAEDPKALPRLFPNGRPAYDSRVIPELIGLLRRWQSRAR